MILETSIMLCCEVEFESPLINDIMETHGSDSLVPDALTQKVHDDIKLLLKGETTLTLDLVEVCRYLLLDIRKLLFDYYRHTGDKELVVQIAKDIDVDMHFPEKNDEKLHIDEIEQYGLLFKLKNLPRSFIDLNNYAYYGHIDCVKYIIEAKIKDIDDFTLYHAGESGNLELFKYVHEQCKTINIQGLIGACKGGNLECLKYAESHVKPYYSSSAFINDAVTRQHFNVVKYLHQSGAPWDEFTVIRAIDNDDEQILEYLVKHNCPYPTENWINSRNKCLQYLHNHTLYKKYKRERDTR